MVFTKKLVLLFAKLILFLIAIGVIVYIFYRLLPNFQQLPEKKQVSQEAPSATKNHAMTTLFVDAVNASVSGTSLEIPIAIDTGGNTVSVVELHLSFDAKLLKRVSIQPGNFFSNPMIIEKSIDAAKGTIVFVLGSLTPRRGVGSLVTVTAIPVQKTSITIHIDSKTKVAAIGEIGTVLSSTRDGTVQVP
ncbi:MAG: cohesin domain-containing protein [Candidatus Gottesmanbacteria bacterium]|nr:cohesin domain-containing protein [Candidatus Gottesmanbacteria bacterium]